MVTPTSRGGPHLYSMCFVELSDSSNRSAALPPALDVCMCVKISLMIHSIQKRPDVLLGVFILVLMIIFVAGEVLECTMHF